MSRALERRLHRVEAAVAPKVLGHFHCIYARDGQDYERQRADLIASGRAKPTDIIFDTNWQSWQQRGWCADAPEYVGDAREPETHAWGEPHSAWVIRMAKEDSL